MSIHSNRLGTAVWLAAGILTIFILRTLLAANMAVPRLFDLFDTLTLAGAAFILWHGRSRLKPSDWYLAALLGSVVGIGMMFATLFSPYPYFDIIRSRAGMAAIRGIATSLACLGGLVVMRQDGPIQFHAASRQPGQTGRSLLFGLTVGLPLAILNIFALQYSQGQSISWQNPVAALLDALQPAIVEEFIYRFALWGLLWLVLRGGRSPQPVWAAGLLAMLVHNYAHFDTLFVQSPLTAVGMGLVLMLLWGLPPTLLARYRGLEAAVAFHWIQDAARFLAGF